MLLRLRVAPHESLNTAEGAGVGREVGFEVGGLAREGSLGDANTKIVAFSAR